MLNQSNILRRTGCLLIISLVLITISYLYIDRYVAWFFYNHHSHQWPFLPIIANDIVATLVYAVVIFYIYYAIRWVYSQLQTWENKGLLIANAIAISIFIKNLLKYIFSRYWPATYKCHNLSLIHNHAYGFRWFDTHFSSFPSGHATLMWAFAISMCCFYPSFKWLWLAIAIIVCLAQIALYYHFVSDIIAGATLGSLVALFCSNHYRIGSSHSLV